MNFFKNQIKKYFIPENILPAPSPNNSNDKKNIISNYGQNCNTQPNNQVIPQRKSTDTFEVIEAVEEKDSYQDSFQWIGEDLSVKYYLIENQFFNDVIFEQDDVLHILTKSQWRKIIESQSYSGTNHKNLIFSILKGIPFQIRKDLWEVLAQVKLMKTQIKKTYQELLKMECKSLNMIQKDVPRTGPNNKYQKQLTNVLIAYSNLDPSGYTQGMNFICLSLLKLLSLQNDPLIEKLQLEIYEKQFEERVFWIFVGIMYGKNWKECFENNLAGVSRMIDILEKLMKKYTPDILQHLKNNQIDLKMCFVQYYLTLFIYNTPFGFAKTILDLFLLQGEKIMHSLIVKMIKICRQKILNIHDMGKLIYFFKVEMLEYCYRTNEEQKAKATSLQDFTINFFNLTTE